MKSKRYVQKWLNEQQYCLYNSPATHDMSTRGQKPYDWEILSKWTAPWLKLDEWKESSMRGSDPFFAGKRSKLGIYTHLSSWTKHALSLANLRPDRIVFPGTRHMFLCCFWPPWLKPSLLGCLLHQANFGAQGLLWCNRPALTTTKLTN